MLMVGGHTEVAGEGRGSRQRKLTQSAQMAVGMACLLLLGRKRKGPQEWESFHRLRLRGA